MGRALFSDRYGYKAPAIRVEPEPVYPNPDKWSVYNRFDPDSEEFFEDAEFEAFVDPTLVDVLDRPLPVAEESASSSSSSSDSDSGRDSPLLIPSSRPVRVNAIWDRLVDDSVAEPAADDQLLADIPGYARTGPYTRPDPDALDIVQPIHPPSALRNSTTATDLGLAPSPRRISVPAISIPFEPSSLSPASPASPSTPPAMHAHLQMATPSPPPTVTPRIYMWGARPHVPASPASPSVRRTHPAGPGPLTNPGARQSVARIPIRSV